MTEGKKGVCEKGTANHFLVAHDSNNKPIIEVLTSSSQPKNTGEESELVLSRNPYNLFTFTTDRPR